MIKRHHNQSTSSASDADRGFTLVELLVVIVVLGILATVTVFAVRGVTDKGEQSACGADVRTITLAADFYLADNGLAAVPATGSGDDQYEQTLINAGLLKETSTYYDLNADGTVSTNGVPCN